jgi:hypothetical protein
MVIRVLAAVCVFAVSSAAQTSAIVPPSHAALEGTTGTNVPFGRSTPTRVQCAYDAMLFAAPVVVTEIALRPDGGVMPAGKIVDCEIRMSTMPLPLVQMSTSFAANRGADEVVVLPRQLLALPAAVQVGTPSPLLPPIPLSVPFAYDPAAGALLVEIVVHAQPPGAYSLDATYVCSSPEVAIGPPWVARVLDAAPGAVVLFVVGTVESGSVGGLVLPQDLAIVGAPGCMLSIDVAGSWYTIAAGDGTGSFPFVLDNSPSSLGQWIRFQGATLDASANALGIVTSQAKKVQVCGWEPVARVWSSGVLATAGTREIGVAPVLRLSIQ